MDAHHHQWVGDFVQMAVMMVTVLGKLHDLAGIYLKLTVLLFPFKELIVPQLNGGFQKMITVALIPLFSLMNHTLYCVWPLVGFWL